MFASCETEQFENFIVRERLEDGTLLQDPLELFWDNQCAIFGWLKKENGQKMISLEVMAKDLKQDYRIVYRLIGNTRFLFSQQIQDFNYDRYCLLKRENNPYIPYEEKYWENAESCLKFISNLIEDRSFADLPDLEKVSVQNPLGKIEITDGKRTNLIELLTKINNTL